MIVCSQPIIKQYFPCTYAQLPENAKLVKIANLYAKAFADFPWNEYKVCPKRHYFGIQQKDLMYCTNQDCGLPLTEAYPEKETAEYIAAEVGKTNGKLITFENENGEIFAAGWGYECTIKELQEKYHSAQMQEKVADQVTKTAGKVERIFYLSEIMVGTAVRNQGIATQISQHLFAISKQLELNLVMRTRSDSPMVRIADKMHMSKIIDSGEDLDNLNRVLYINL